MSLRRCNRIDLHELDIMLKVWNEGGGKVGRNCGSPVTVIISSDRYLKLLLLTSKCMLKLKGTSPQHPLTTLLPWIASRGATIIRLADNCNAASFLL